jgi:hypothetical protein
MYRTDSGSPDENRFLDTESPRVELHPKHPLPAGHEALVRKKVPERIRREDDEIRGEGRGVGFEVEDLRGGGAEDTEEGAEEKDAEGERGESGVVCRWDGLGR